MNNNFNHWYYVGVFIMGGAEAVRRDLVKKIFPEGIPQLWSPPLTYYTSSGMLDKKRIRAHLAQMAPYIKTHLIPGSTGDGWELSQKEIDELLEFIIRDLRDLGIRLLIGILRPDADSTRRDMESALKFLKKITGVSDPEKALYLSGVAGFTVCAPIGQDLTQEFIGSKLGMILDLGYPTVLYQLPQITKNEIAPETFEALATNYGNFYMFKDTSGRDAVALSRINTGGVFMVRGAEGDYCRWFKGTPGGVYDGFLLGSANCFAQEYLTMLEDINAQRNESALATSNLLSKVVASAMTEAGNLSFGNAFANANKAIDHFFAHGQDTQYPMPMTHSGNPLPEQYMNSIRKLLDEEGLMPAWGYLRG